MSLFDAVIASWRARFPTSAVDQFLAAEGPAVRAALDDAERQVRERRSQRKFDAWLDGQALAGRDFDEAQLRWLDWMRQDIAAEGELAVAQLGRGRYAEAGGPDKAARLFGRRTLDEVVASLNATFGKPAGCGCGGACRTGGGGCGCAKTPAPPVLEGRLHALRLGEAPAMAPEFAVYREMVEGERPLDADSDLAVTSRLLAAVDARMALGEGERQVIAQVGLEYATTRAEALVLRGAGWDAIALLLPRPALVLAGSSEILAVRDAMGRLAPHPDREGTLGHLFAEVRRAEETVQGMVAALEPARTRADLGPFAVQLWQRAREYAAQRSGRRTSVVSEHVDRGLSGQTMED